MTNLLYGLLIVDLVMVLVLAIVVVILIVENWVADYKTKKYAKSKESNMWW